MKTLFKSSLVLLVLLLAACQPAARSPVPVEVQPQRPYPTPLPSLPQYRIVRTAVAQPTAVFIAPPDNQYRDYGVNPNESTDWDNLSTFAVDVDTASYTIARRYVLDGQLPPYDAVRVEEFVNYFNMGYPSPQQNTFAIYADGAPSPFHDDGTYLLRFGIQGRQVAERERQPVSLVFVIDISGSMDMENRLGLVKDSLRLLVERLRPDDSVGIVVYGSQARVELQPISARDKRRIIRIIDSLRTEGATNAEEGLRLGFRMALENYRFGTNNRVVLCSDGVANVGITDPDGLLEQVRGYVQEGISLSTYGFGMGNYNDVLMEQLANNGNGMYAYVDDALEARRLFVDNLIAALETIALDARVQVDFNPQIVSEYRLIGYENRDMADEEYFDDSVDAGEIGAGHSVTAVYAVKLYPEAWGEIATLYLRWKDPQTYQVMEMQHSLYAENLSRSFEAAGPRFQLSAVVAQYAEILRQSPYAGRNSLREVSRHAARLTRLIPDDPDVAEFNQLVSRAARMRR